MRAQAVRPFQLLSEYLDFWANERPDAEFLADRRRRLTYGEVALAVEHCAKALVASGVRPGDRVAVLTTPRVEFGILYLAIGRIGACFVALNPRHQYPELEYVVADCAPAAIFGIDGFEGRDYRQDLARLSETHQMPRPIHLDDPGGEFDRFLATGAAAGLDVDLDEAAASVSPEQCVCIVYTSGSTGHPKGAMLSHHGMTAAHRRLIAEIGGEPLRMIAELPVDHVAGLERLYSTLLTGGFVYLLERFRPAALLEAIERERATAWIGELTQAITLAPLLERYDLSSLQVVGYAGGPPERQVLQAMSEVAPRILTGYGMTETSNAILITDRDVTLEQLAGHNVGRPIEGVVVRLVDEDRTGVAPGEVGQLEVRSDTLLLGYLNRDDATARAFTPDGWFKTGDLMQRVADGSFEFVGRSDATFKSGGYNVYPREVELVLEEHPAVSEAAVVAVSDPVFQTVGYAYVATTEGALEAELEILLEHCRERLANYKVPKRIAVLNELPRLRNEKIDRVQLQSRAEAPAETSLRRRP